MQIELLFAESGGVMLAESAERFWDSGDWDGPGRSKWSCGGLF